jgi:hypothetical protein
VTLAFRYYAQEPTIYTNDRAFAALDPSEYDLPKIDVEFVPSDDSDSSGERPSRPNAPKSVAAG